MRNKIIPDHFVGDRHLTNWFKKHLQMPTLSLIFVDPVNYFRRTFSKSEVMIETEFSIFLTFEDGKTISMRVSDTEFYVERNL